MQRNCRDIHVTYRASAKRKDKRAANRRHRRALNRKTRAFVDDVDAFEGEDFAAPSFSNWDID